MTLRTKQKLPFPILVCLLSGASMTLAFAPFHFDLIALFIPAILCGYWLNASAKQALWQGWLFGFGWAITGSSWVYISIHRYGGDGIILSGFLVTLMAALIAIYYALQGYCLNKLFPRNTLYKILLAFPAIWVISEWLRGYLFSGIPWFLLGNTQTTSPFNGYAPILSVYGISLIIALVNGCWVAFFYYRQKKIIPYLCLIGIFVLALVGLALSHIQWTHPSHAPVRVALVQGNVPQQTKWDPNQAQQTLQTYLHLTQQQWTPLIFWPEGAVPMYQDQAADYLYEIDTQAKLHHSAVLFGIPIENMATGQYYNGALVFGDGHGQYLKHHLVPFGEYTPLEQWFGPVFKFFSVPMSNFSSGPAVQPLMHMGQFQIALFICFESIFPEQVRQQLQNADFIVTISDDGWFGDSLGPPQHEQIDQMRALETGRYVIRDTNNGITSIINDKGKIIAQVPKDQSTVLVAQVTPMIGETPWIRFGMLPIWILIVAMLLVARMGQSMHRID